MANSNILGMMFPCRDFTSIRILIQGSMVDGNISFNRYVTQLVRDAQMVLKSPDNISTIDRELFFYSVYLVERGGSWVRKMNPDNLIEDDYRRMLEIFKMP